MKFVKGKEDIETKINDEKGGNRAWNVTDRSGI